MTMLVLRVLYEKQEYFKVYHSASEMKKRNKEPDPLIKYYRYYLLSYKWYERYGGKTKAYTQESQLKNRKK